MTRSFHKGVDGPETAALTGHGPRDYVFEHFSKIVFEVHASPPLPLGTLISRPPDRTQTRAHQNDPLHVIRRPRGPPSTLIPRQRPQPATKTKYWVKQFTPGTDDLYDMFPVDDLDSSGKIST